MICPHCRNKMNHGPETIFRGWICETPECPWEGKKKKGQEVAKELVRLHNEAIEGSKK